jgi:hypothetical protein
MLAVPNSRSAYSVVCDANAGTVSAAALAWPGQSMATLSFYGGSGRAGPAFGRARSRALSRLSAMPWA